MSEAKTITIYSTRPAGYRQCGIHFGRHPTSFIVLDVAPTETAAQRTERHGRKQLTRDEVSAIRAQIARAQSVGVEPALAIHDAEQEEAQASRLLSEYREQLEATRRARDELEQQIAGMAVERQAMSKALEEMQRDLARAQDEAAAAADKLTAAESALGTIEQLSADKARLQAELQQAKKGRGK